METQYKVYEMQGIAIKDVRSAARGEEPVSRERALGILCSSPAAVPDMLAAASRVRRRFFGDKFRLCTILNAKSGACSEDCVFCSQSSRHHTGTDVYDLRKSEEIVAAHEKAEDLPITHFGVVTSGPSLGEDEVERVCKAIRGKARSSLEWCASLGAIGAEQFGLLKAAGLKRFHHNLETAESFFPNICATHTYADRLHTIRTAKEVGLEICSGGILGLGETNEQRVEFAFALQNEKVNSIPLNFLVPIRGTRLEYLSPMKPLDIIRCVAMFRLVNPRAEIKVCAGRTHLRDLQSMIFYAGATGMMIGPLLTVAGRNVDDDLQMLKDLEMEVEGPDGVMHEQSEQWIERGLADLREQSLERSVKTYPRVGGRIQIGSDSFLNFSSNDYLNLANDPRIKTEAERLLREMGSGATASRLIAGTLDCHTELEERLAVLKGYPSALVFGSGYLTNVGTIPAVVGRDDHVFADKLAHASIVDGMVLSRARIHRFNHNDPEHLATLLKKCPSTGKRLVITESVFSMDGDLAPLSTITNIAREHEAMLMVDEAHATGVFGPAGAGLINEQSLEASVNISMGTLSKAFGSYGGFVACSSNMRKLLINRSKAFIYTTALPPPVIGSVLGALAVLESNPGMGSTLLRNAVLLRSQLGAAGLNVGLSESQIIPVIVGDAARTLSFSERLRNKGVLAVAIRPPTVPTGTARLRLSVTLAHTKDDLQRAAEIMVRCAKDEGII